MVVLIPAYLLKANQEQSLLKSPVLTLITAASTQTCTGQLLFNKMLNFNSILLSSENPKKLSDFYGKVFEKAPDMDDNDYTGFLVGSCFLTIGPHTEVKGKNSNPERMIYNLETPDVEKEFDRIKKLGAKVIAEPYKMGDGNMWIATFADPDGNFFQLMSPWEERKN